MKYFKTVQEGILINTSQGPVRYLCNDLSDYSQLKQVYSKYIYDWDHFDCLVYELLVPIIGNFWGIETPEIGIVEVQHQYDAPHNRIHPIFHEGIDAFGCVNLESHDVLKEEFYVKNRSDFNKLARPLDWVTISLLDLWIDNRDRTKGNSNLLIDPKHNKWVIFDHYDCFGGTANVGKIDPKLKIHSEGMFMHSQYGQVILNWLNYSDYNKEIEKFEHLAKDKTKIQDIVDNVFSFIPKTWEFTKDLKEHLTHFLLDYKRIDRVIEHYTDKTEFKVGKK